MREKRELGYSEVDNVTFISARRDGRVNFSMVGPRDMFRIGDVIVFEGLEMIVHGLDMYATEDDMVDWNVEMIPRSRA